MVDLLVLVTSLVCFMIVNHGTPTKVRSSMVFIYK